MFFSLLETLKCCLVPLNFLFDLSITNLYLFILLTTTILFYSFNRELNLVLNLNRRGSLFSTKELFVMRILLYAFIILNLATLPIIKTFMVILSLFIIIYNVNEKAVSLILEGYLFILYCCFLGDIYFFIISYVCFVIYLQHVKNNKFLFFEERLPLGLLFLTIILASFFSLLLYFRLILERVPQQITFEFNLLLVSFVLVSVIILGYTIMVLLKQLLKIDIKPVFSFISFSLMKEKVSLSFTRLVSSIVNTSFSRYLCTKLTIYFYTHKNIHIWLTLFLDFIPKMLVACALALDVFVFLEFNLFYKSISILLIPLVYQILLYFIYFWVLRVKEQLRDIVEYYFIEDNVRFLFIGISSEEEQDLYITQLSILIHFLSVYDQIKNRTLFLILKLIPCCVFFLVWSYFLENSIDMLVLPVAAASSSNITCQTKVITRSFAINFYNFNTSELKPLTTSKNYPHSLGVKDSNNEAICNTTTKIGPHITNQVGYVERNFSKKISPLYTRNLKKRIFLADSDINDAKKTFPYTIEGRREVNILNSSNNDSQEYYISDARVIEELKNFGINPENSHLANQAKLDFIKYSAIIGPQKNKNFTTEPLDDYTM